MEERVQYPVAPSRTAESARCVATAVAQRVGDDSASTPETPVTVATPVIPLPEWDGRQDGDGNEDSGRGGSSGSGDARPHFRNRMVLCLLAVAANWGTTLRVANDFASRAVLVPSLDFVVRTCRSALDATREERTRHSWCVESQLRRCDARLDESLSEEDGRVRELAERNEELVRRMEEVATNCSESYATLRRALEDWTANGGEIPLSKKCSAEDREQFNETLMGTQNTLALQTEALQMASAYTEESASTVALLASTAADLDREIAALDEYIAERAKYDVNYIDRKTQFIQDELMDVIESLDPAKVPPLELSDLFDDLASAVIDLKACVSLDASARMANGAECRPNLAAMVDDFVEDAKWKVEVLDRTLQDYRDTLLEYRDRMEEYKQNAMDAYDNAKRFYDGAKAFINVARVVVFWENIGDWFDVSDTDFFPVEVDFPDVNIPIPDVGPFGSVDAMWAKVAPGFDAFLAELESIPPAIADRFQDLIEGVVLRPAVSLFGLIPRIMPDDYRPPKFVGKIGLEINPEEELSSYKNRSQLFISQTRAALGMFSGIGNEYDDDVLNVAVPALNISEIKSKVTNIDLAFEGLQQPDVDFDLWFLQLSQLSHGFVLVDYIFRAYVSIRLLMRYWFATSLAMPVIDLRANKEIKNPFRMHPARAAISFATSPMGGFAIFLASSAWIIGIIWALYAPLLHSFTSGCVSANGNGTFLTKNLFSIAYNHAYQDGSGLLLEGMDAFDLKRGDACSSRYTASAALQNSMASNFSTYSSFHREVSDNMGLTQRCIDIDELDSAFGDACCGVVTYPDCAIGQSSSDVTCPMDEQRTIMDISIPYELPGKSSPSNSATCKSIPRLNVFTSFAGLSLADPSCSAIANESDWMIKDAVFDCEQLESCSVTCPGPHKRRLNSVCERCGCTLEWYLHSKWMGSTFAFLLYIFMNVARVTFFSGVTRLLWKHIYPEQFTVSVTCDAVGTLVTPSKINGSTHEDIISAIQNRSSTNCDVGCHNLSKELHAKLKRCLRSFYIIGVALLLGSILANGAWIYALAVTSQTLIPHVWR
ncbi:hypothetical protein ACHAWF_014838 [Thalassiosira exigua]